MAVEVNRAGNVAQVNRKSERSRAFKVPEHVRLTHGPDGGTVLDVLHGQMFRLNLVGSRTLELVKQGLAEPEIAEQLAREFRIDGDRAAKDVREFVGTLEKHRLLTSLDNNPLA